MNIYESMIILNAAISDEEADAAVTRIKDLITGQGGEVLKVDVWGRRKLSYELKKQKKGLYVLLFYKAPASTIRKLEELFKVFDTVVKYIIFRLGRKQVQNLEKAEPATETPAEQKIQG
ncbi:MAG: 30S ribosomal protein S6 [Thermodesulfovibrionales bacterium]|jgi:small subunit ribosomal protein S6|nr:30S ribosomal protein S6 [Thermodesulfovibrionales bacterium]